MYTESTHRHPYLIGEQEVQLRKNPLQNCCIMELTPEKILLHVTVILISLISRSTTYPHNYEPLALSLLTLTTSSFNKSVVCVAFGILLGKE